MMTEKKLIAKIEGRMQSYLWDAVPLLSVKSKCHSYSSASETALPPVLLRLSSSYFIQDIP